MAKDNINTKERSSLPAILNSSAQSSVNGVSSVMHMELANVDLLGKDADSKRARDLLGIIIAGIIKLLINYNNN